MTQFRYFSTDHESYPSTVPFIFTFTAALRKTNFSVLNTQSFGMLHTGWNSSSIIFNCVSCS